MVYAKRVVADVKLTTYGRVLYTNLLASVPCGVWLPCESWSVCRKELLFGLHSCTRMSDHSNLFCAAFFALVGGEVSELPMYLEVVPQWAYTAIFVTCVLGYGMSYLSWALRAEVSALTFVVIGILCKIGSVVINAMFLSKHLTLKVWDTWLSLSSPDWLPVRLSKLADYHGGVSYCKHLACSCMGGMLGEQ